MKKYTNNLLTSRKNTGGRKSASFKPTESGPSTFAYDEHEYDDWEPPLHGPNIDQRLSDEKWLKAKAKKQSAQLEMKFEYSRE